MSDHDRTGPDDRDLDDGGLDLTPRVTEPGRTGRTGKRWGPLAVLVALVGVGAFIMMQAGGASLYFLNADEAVAQREELGSDRFRLQGTVIGEPTDDGANTLFRVQYNGVNVDVRHTGSEPAMFDAGVPVVAEGAWNVEGTEFQSDRILVKHDENYKDDNPTRLDGDESNDR